MYRFNEQYSSSCVTPPGRYRIYNLQIFPMLNLIDELFLQLFGLCNFVFRNSNVHFDHFIHKACLAVFSGTCLEEAAIFTVCFGKYKV